MRWTGGRESENLEDRRRSGPGTVAIGGVGTLIIVVIGLFMGVDPRDLIRFVNRPQVPGGPVAEQTQRPETPEEARSRRFAATILGFTEEVWDDQFRRSGSQYERPHMVLFSQNVETGCGAAPSAVGPFYCPADRTVYLDPTFFTELEERLGGSSAEFSQAYVIAHEIGHHVQNLLGYTRIVDEKRRTTPPREANRWSVRLELQADYLAGVWAHYGQQKFNFIEAGDVDAAIATTRAIGDDRLQRAATGFTSPEKYTHGTSEQRGRWFRRGLETGDLSRLKEIFELDDSEL